MLRRIACSVALMLPLALLGWAVAAARSSRARIAFAPSSPWNTPIPADPALDRNSAAMVRYLAAQGRAYADLYASGTPVFESHPGDPPSRVTCTEHWGVCQLAQQPLHLPADASPAAGSDGSMVLISGNVGYDFWHARRISSNRWVAGWGTRFELDGDGAGGGATGSGIPLLAGLPRLSEMEAGQVDHALGFITEDVCGGVHRYPASKSDGWSRGGSCIPEGTRIQLDPHVNIDAIPGLSAGERIVARALQRYGAYCKDRGDARLAFSFEDPVGKPNPYPGLGFHWDYYAMTRIPWQDLRVLRRWNGR